MKRYRICFFIMAVAVFCFLAGGFFYALRFEKKLQKQEHIRVENTEGEGRKGNTTKELGLQQELLAEYEKIGNQMADEEAVPVNQPPEEVSASQGEYYLVEENGFLLVFCKDKTTLCLHTHMPVSDFPAEEQAKLMEGIWFSSMLDVFNYLESYTS